MGSRRDCRSITPFPRREAVDTGLLVVKEDEAPLVPVIFDLYTNKRMGSRAVAQWLNRRGHRTKSGRPWGHTAVLTVLSNRAYVEEIFFRGRYHPAPHPRLVEAKVFETAQAILESRGEDMALRRTNGSDYLLTGLLVCEKCGKHFIGASAQEKAYRYAYYVCFSRHRYGTQECDQDRLRADELEDRVVESLLSTLARRELLEEAVERWGEIVETVFRNWRTGVFSRSPTSSGARGFGPTSPGSISPSLETTTEGQRTTAGSSKVSRGCTSWACSSSMRCRPASSGVSGGTPNMSSKRSPPGRAESIRRWMWLSWGLRTLLRWLRRSRERSAPSRVGPHRACCTAA